MSDHYDTAGDELPDDHELKHTLIHLTDARNWALTISDPLIREHIQSHVEHGIDYTLRHIVGCTTKVGIYPAGTIVEEK